MKKHTKKILGLCGLGAVVATTALAVAMPNNPEALATTGTKVSDTIQVRVVGPEVEATITSPTNGVELVTPNQEIAFDYANAHTITADLEYTNINGFTTNVYHVVLEKNYEAGSYSKMLNLDNYGYGHYKLSVVSEGLGGETDRDSVAFKYLPMTGTAAQIGTTEAVKVDLNYDTSEGSPVKAIRLDVYLHGIYAGKSVWVTAPDTTVNIDFTRMLSGNYTIVATAYGASGLPLFAQYFIPLAYQSPLSPIPVPNTGSNTGIFEDSNISQTDYLITGLIIFGIVAVAGIVFMMRNDKRRK